jgi:hypothetical protein
MAKSRAQQAAIAISMKKAGKKPKQMKKGGKAKTLSKVSKQLAKASKMHAGQSKKIAKLAEMMKEGGYPKSDKNDFMKRMGYYQGGGLAATPMYGSNTIPGSPETASITYQEADKARLKALEDELKESQESTKFQDEAEAEIQKQAATISNIEQGLSQGTKGADKLGLFDKLKEKGAQKTADKLGQEALMKGTTLAGGLSDDALKALAPKLFEKGTTSALQGATSSLPSSLANFSTPALTTTPLSQLGTTASTSLVNPALGQQGANLLNTGANVGAGAGKGLIGGVGTGGVGAIASLAGEGIKMASDDQDATTMNTGETVGSGLSGIGTGIGAAMTTAALMGSSLGPVGTAAGVIGGAVYGLGKGLIQRGKARREEKKAEKRQKAAVAKIASIKRLEALKSKEYSGYDFGADLRQSGGFSKKLDALQDSLTVAGIIPALGAVPDLINTGISGGRAVYNYATGDTAAAKSNLANAGVSLVSAVPGYGDALSVPKVAKTAIKYGSKVKKGKAAANLLATSPAERMPSMNVDQTFSAESTGVRSPIIPEMMNLPKFPQQPPIPKIGPSTRKHGGVKQAGGYKDAFMKGIRYPVVGDRYDTEKSVENLQGYIANEEEAARSLKRATNIKKQIDSGNFNLQGAPNIPNAPSYSDLLDTQKASMDTIRSNFHGQVFDLPTTKKQKGGVKLPGGMAKPIPGSDAIEFKGKSHAQGGIMVDPMTEVEGDETMDKVTMKHGGKSDYFFSQHLKMGGKSFAQRHKDILKNGGRQKDIDALAKLQEKKAGRNPNDVKLGAGGYYQGGGPFNRNPNDFGQVYNDGTPVYNDQGLVQPPASLVQNFQNTMYPQAIQYPVVGDIDPVENSFKPASTTTTTSNTKNESTNTTNNGEEELNLEEMYPNIDPNNLTDSTSEFVVPGPTDGLTEIDIQNSGSNYNLDIPISEEDQNIINKANSGADLTDLEKKALKRLGRDVPGLALAAGAAQLIAPAYAFFKKDRVAEQMGSPGRIKAPTLDRISYNTERAANAADNRAMNRFIETSGIGPAGIIAKMSAYRRKQDGDLKIAAQESRVNTEIANREAQMAQQANVRNVANAMQADQINTRLREAQLAANENRRLEAVDAFTERTAGLAGDLMSYKATERLARATGDMGIYERDRLRNFLKNQINPRTGKPYTNADIAEVFNKRFAQPTATEDDKKEKE